ncbi:MAG: class I SAM-dependent methyltransferase [Pedobacter sp.]|nr:MAG: class I SAM-dependent methyltransferase [Pedobacter sp.]
MDIYGLALSDYYGGNENNILWLYNSYAEPEEMPVDIFFRSEDDMPELEHHALSACRGKILDVGAGAGSHSIALQKRGLDVTAIDISKIAVDIMRKRGVKNALEQDIFALEEKYDTLFFMMNGIGLTGTLAGFNAFLDQAERLLNPSGQLLFDSSDISYLYEDLPKPENNYFGEVSYCYEYKQQKGKWFNWLYIDQQMLRSIATTKGWNCEIIFDDGEDQFLARLTKS